MLAKDACILGRIKPATSPTLPASANRALYVQQTLLEAPNQCKTAHPDHTHRAFWSLVGSWSSLSEANLTDSRLRSLAHGYTTSCMATSPNSGRTVRRWLLG
ncbi:uncharacterized protein BDCG_01613 [Blastomyces dermatitidis ER-3]|uniref:Uncharacterized protein n=3 Tax=Blastomyces TaxID=229219 RepID=A0A179UP07_BLAGS|nr:uncharacterized protein BDBG_04549 [Blastomyces gilchristii SLH14081]XP_045274035.1 uncharacterized protein BDCG_01613 [Blastomyces dermatitidis ER-3]EEQ86493.2 hypothetical protein BDCG_01613 [Blastomyces dermatitidis ER-3]EGE79121.1 hypothetical protein BDDG_02059 [Blastomyces dermatitidis ATCC 18188]OAT08958.1 hypothetical protein BDBG_04549 [Blastomyces gilchristii SLH14081]